MGGNIEAVELADRYCCTYDIAAAGDASETLRRSSSRHLEVTAQHLPKVTKTLVER